MIATLFGWRATSGLIARQQVDRLDLRVREKVNAVYNDLRDQTLFLRAAAGLFDASEEVTRAEWSVFFRSLEMDRDAFGKEFGFAPRVKSGEREEHVQWMRSEGFPDYTVAAAEEREEVFPVVYIEPFDEGNRHLLGRDLSAELVQPALQRAANTGQAVLSGKVKLPCEEGEEETAGFLIGMPVYHLEMPLRTAAERQAALFGFVYRIFHAGDFLDTLFPAGHPYVQLRVFDGTDPSSDTLLFDGVSDFTTEFVSGSGRSLMREERMEWAGQQWTLQFFVTPAFFPVAERNFPPAILAGGILLSLGLGIILFKNQGIREHSRQLQQSEANLAATLYSIGDGVISSDVKGRVTALNAVAERLTGWTLAEARGRPIDEIFQIIHEKTRRPAVVPIWEVLASGEIRGLANHTALISRDGTEYPIADSAAPIRDARERVTGAVMVFRDVTAQRAAETTELAAKEWEETFDAIHDLVVVLDHDRRILRANRAWKERFGDVSPEGAFCYQAMHGKSMPSEGCPSCRAFAGGRTESLEFQEPHCGGRWFDSFSFPVKNSAGEVRRVVHVIRDITGRKEAEQAISESEARYRHLVENTTDVTYMADPDGRLSYVGPQVNRYGLDSAAMTGQSFFDFIEPEDRDRVAADFQRTMTEGEEFPTVFRLKNPGGRTVWIEDFGKVLRDESGRINGLSGILHDVTEREHARRALEQANAELEQRVAERTAELVMARDAADAANQAKSAFLAGMSHELRTPLNAIIGFSEVLNQELFGALNGKQKEYVNDIHESGRHLHELINDILDLSKIEAGKVEPEWSQVRIEEILENGILLIREKCFKHGIDVGIEMDDAVKELEMVADRRRLKQIMYNLLSNAAKFTPDGGSISVTAGLTGPPDAAQSALRVEVADTGIGIEPADQARIFDEFYQVSSGMQDKAPGTGLGLSLVKRMVEMHGGRVRVESEGAGRGTRFVFEIPVSRSDGADGGEEGSV